MCSARVTQASLGAQGLEPVSRWSGQGILLRIAGEGDPCMEGKLSPLSFKGELRTAQHLAGIFASTGAPANRTMGFCCGGTGVASAQLKD